MAMCGLGSANAAPLFFSVPGAVQTNAFAVSNSGAVVGYFEDAQLAVHGFQYSNGTLSYIDAPNTIKGNGYGTVVTGINDAGMMVGYAYISSTEVYAFEYDGSSFHAVGTNGLGLVPTSISNSGVVSGYSQSSTGFILAGNSLQTNSGPNTFFTGGAADGNVLSGYRNSALGGSRGFTYSNGIFTDTPIEVGASFSIPYDVNNAQQTVGYSYFGNGGTSFYYDGVSFFSLPVGWDAHSINDSGEIVGSYGFSGTNRSVAFILNASDLVSGFDLTPPNVSGYPVVNPSTSQLLPEPETYPLLRAGLGLMGVVIRRSTSKQA